MTERSRPWDGTTTGDAIEAPYDAATEWARIFRATIPSMEQTAHKGGVVASATGFSALQPSSPAANTARVASGVAWNQGTWYENDANVDFTIPVPGSSTRVDRIVLRKSWSAQTVRLTRIAGTEGAGTPALVQTYGTTWDVPIGLFSITTGNVITVTDERIQLGALAATNFYRGAATQTLGPVASNSGVWWYFKAYGSTLTINGPANAMIAPGGTAPVSTYASPNGESTDWFCDGTFWTCQ